MQTYRLFPKTIICLIGCLLTFMGQAFASPMHGHVLEVINSYSLKVSVGDEVKIVRFAEIICPDAVLGSFPCKAEAKKFIEEKVLAQDVSLIFWAIDVVGRSVCEVIMPNGTSLGRLLVAKGYALQDKNYSFSKVLHHLQENAKNHRSGVWQYL